MCSSIKVRSDPLAIKLCPNDPFVDLPPPPPPSFSFSERTSGIRVFCAQVPPPPVTMSIHGLQNAKWPPSACYGVLICQATELQFARSGGDACSCGKIWVCVIMNDRLPFKCISFLPQERCAESYNFSTATKPHMIGQKKSKG